MPSRLWGSTSVPQVGVAAPFLLKGLQGSVLESLAFV